MVYSTTKGTRCILLQPRLLQRRRDVTTLHVSCLPCSRPSFGSCPIIRVIPERLGRQGSGYPSFTTPLGLTVINTVVGMPRDGLSNDQSVDM